MNGTQAKGTKLKRAEVKGTELKATEADGTQAKEAQQDITEAKMGGPCDRSDTAALERLLAQTVDATLYRIILSNPRSREKAEKVKIRPVMLKGELRFQKTVYRGKQVFHTNLEKEALIEDAVRLLTQDFRQGEIETADRRATVLISRKGKLRLTEKRLPVTTSRPAQGPVSVTTSRPAQGPVSAATSRPAQRPVSAATSRLTQGPALTETFGPPQAWDLSHNRTKSYIIKEGCPAPFLIDLGVQTKEGEIRRARYAKFRQINRFLEFIEDILPTLPKDRQIRIIDFGCGKSYLTFALYYYLKELKGLDIRITGLDLKEDVIRSCNALAAKYGYENLEFIHGDIQGYGDGREKPGEVDLVVTLHACDTATDYALARAVSWNTGVILSVPCCQHEVNGQIDCEPLAPILKYGLLKERISALLTDGIRANLLEEQGYEVQLLEFIDMEHTPKNLLIRAVRKSHGVTMKSDGDAKAEKTSGTKELTGFLHVETTLQKLL